MRVGLPLLVLLSTAALATACGDVVSLGSGIDPAAGAGGDGGGPRCTNDEQCVVIGAPCLVGSCVEGVCRIEPESDGVPCDDGHVCTLFDVCREGVCRGEEIACPDPGPCLTSHCDELAGGCVIVPGDDGMPCDDFDICTASSICSAGACVGVEPLDCSFLDGPCSFGVCGPTGCETIPANDGSRCEDGFFCTVGETCMAGACVGGVTLECPPPSSPCMVGVCIENLQGCFETPAADGTPCEDGNGCTAGSTCANGACLGGVPTNDGLACNDLNACTGGDVCSGGSCVGTPTGIVLLSDDFSSATNGWLLDPEWEIGPAQASTGGAFGADPETDHTLTADDGVAGVVIGGNASTTLHPPRYLTSPPIDASGAGNVFLSYWRWLDSDYAPFMHNYVEVFDGTEWVVVWSSRGPPAVEDSPPVGIGWRQITHDLTPFKNAKMRVRFGFDVTSAGVFPVGSWNLDDVVVHGCP